MATVGGIKEVEGSANRLEIDNLARFAVDDYNKKQVLSWNPKNYLAKKTFFFKYYPFDSIWPNSCFCAEFSAGVQEGGECKEAGGGWDNLLYYLGGNWGGSQESVWSQGVGEAMAGF